MLEEKDLMKIAFRSCVDMIGYNFVCEREDLTLSCYGDEGDIFNYTLSVDEEDRLINDPLMYENRIVIDETPFDYHATVYIDVNTGEVTRDYENSILPK